MLRNLAVATEVAYLSVRRMEGLSHGTEGANDLFETLEHSRFMLNEPFIVKSAYLRLNRIRPKLFSVVAH